MRPLHAHATSIRTSSPQRFGVSRVRRARRDARALQRVPDRARARRLRRARRARCAGGSIPPWARKLRAGPEPINARAESLLDKRLFAPLIGDAAPPLPRASPTAGTSGCGPSTRRAARTPFRYTVDDGALFAFAGLWREGRVGDERIASVTILTTTANAVCAPVHDRMPCVLAVARGRGGVALARRRRRGGARAPASRSRRRAPPPRPRTRPSTAPASRAPSCCVPPAAAEPEQLRLG